jgi:hypothetical protein
MLIFFVWIFSEEFFDTSKKFLISEIFLPFGADEKSQKTSKVKAILKIK